MGGRLAFLFGVFLAISTSLLAPDAAHAQGKGDGEWVGAIGFDEGSECRADLSFESVTTTKNRIVIRLVNNDFVKIIEAPIDKEGNFSFWQSLDIIDTYIHTDILHTYYIHTDVHI